MVYEISTYWAAEGKLENLHNRFRTLTLGLFKRLGLQVVGFWTPTPATAETGDLVYILAFPDEAAKIAAWETFRADPEWLAGKAKSEEHGVLVTKVVRVLTNPTDYSPLK